MCDQFKASIRKKYNERRACREDQFPRRHSRKLLKLVLVDREQTYGCKERREHNITPIAYDSLFKVKDREEPVRKILVDGNAGIGKTTLCVSISEDWANGILFQQFELVLLLPLRHKMLSSAVSLDGLLKLLHPNEEVRASVARYVEQSEGEKVLMIADGWDELDELQRQEGSFLHELLFGVSYSLMSVVVTSRPSASDPLRTGLCCDRLVEVRGFSKENVREYIQSEFKSDQGKANHLLEQLEDNPLVAGVCSVPLNCAIVCHLWRALEEVLPTTMTELYTKVVLNVLFRNLRKVDTYKSVKSIESFEFLPKELQETWWHLCEFAFVALEEDKLVFPEEDLMKFFPQGLDEVLYFGLLQSAEIELVVGCRLSFNFLHLTFQEYLAARHLANQLPDDQLKIIQLQAKSTRFNMVHRFYCGIIYDKSGGSSSLPTVENLVDSLFSNRYYLDTHLFHCAFESRNVALSQEIACKLTKGGYTHSFGLSNTPHDCMAVIHVMRNVQKSEKCCHVEISFINCGLGEKQISALADVLASKSDVMKVEKLSLAYNRLGVSGVKALTKVLCHPTLEHLKSVFLKGCLSQDAEVNSGLLRSFAHCYNLNWVDVSSNILGVPEASALAITMSEIAVNQRNHKRQESFKLDPGISLMLENTQLGDEGLIAFTKNLKGTFYFEQLELSGNGIHAAGLSCLADSIYSRTIIVNRAVRGICGRHIPHSLQLSDNPLGIEGTLAVGKILSSSSFTCNHFYLSRCQLTTATSGGFLPNTDPPHLVNCARVGQLLCQMNPKNTVNELYLHGNNFSGEGINILVGLMYLCPCLIELFTTNCGLTSEDIKQLIDQLDALKSSKVCSKLESWNLGNNQIDHSGVSALLKCAYSLFPCIPGRHRDGLNFRGNPVDDAMMRMVDEEMNRIRQMRFGSCSRSSLLHFDWMMRFPNNFITLKEESTDERIKRIILSDAANEAVSPSLLPSRTEEGISVAADGELHSPLATDYHNKRPGPVSLLKEMSVAKRKRLCPQESSQIMGGGTPTTAGNARSPMIQTELMEMEQCSHPTEASHIVESSSNCGPEFLNSFTPSQLTAWLVKVYGKDYKDDIDVLKEKKINGELFLQLKEDPEFNDFQISHAFKKLISKKIDEVFQQSDRPTATTQTSLSPEHDAQGTSLNIGNLAKIQNLIWDARNEWHNIGLGLGVSYSSLKSIERYRRQKPEDCLRDMLSHWLSSSHCRRTWDVLAEVLRSKTVGHKCIADEIIKLN